MKLKIVKNGNGYAFAIPKGLINSGILDLEKKEYEIEVKDSKTSNIEEELRFLRQKIENRDLIPDNAKSRI